MPETEPTRIALGSSPSGGPDQGRGSVLPAARATGRPGRGPGRRPEGDRRRGARGLRAMLRYVEPWLRRRPGWTRRALAAGVIAVALVAGMLWVAVGSPALRVEAIEVVGVDPAQRLEIQRMTAKYVGRPLLQVDSSSVATEVSGLKPYSRVDVSREWPHTLRVAVVIRTPVFAVGNAQGSVDLADRDGVRFTTVAKAPAGVPVVALAHPDNPREAAAAGAVVWALDAGQRARVSAVRVGSPDDVRFDLDGVHVSWGGPGDGALKRTVMTALLGQKGVVSINVSAPRDPVATYR